MAAVGSATERKTHATLSGTTVDTVTMPLAETYEVFNRSGSATLWVTGPSVTAPSDPVAAAAGTDFVPAGTSVQIARASAASQSTGLIFKVLGSGNAYSVVAL